MIDEIDGFDPDVDSSTEFISELEKLHIVDTNNSDLVKILRIEEMLGDKAYRDAWFDRFRSECDDLMASTMSRTEFEDLVTPPMEGDLFGTTSRSSIGARLTELKELLDRGLISEAQFDDKRSKLIDEL